MLGVSLIGVEWRTLPAGVAELLDDVLYVSGDGVNLGLIRFSLDLLSRLLTTVPWGIVARLLGGEYMCKVPVADELLVRGNLCTGLIGVIPVLPLGGLFSKSLHACLAIRTPLLARL